VLWQDNGAIDRWARRYLKQPASSKRG